MSGSLVSSLGRSISSPAFLLGLGLGAGAALLASRALARQVADLVRLDEDDNESGVCSSGDESSEFSDVSDDQDMKMMLVVRNELKMGKGKAAAQCAHATLGAYKQARRKCPDLLHIWEATGQPKIAVKVETEADLQLLLGKARSLGLVSYLVADAGRTQIAAGSQTVLAVGPGPGNLVDQVTGGLKLF